MSERPALLDVVVCELIDVIAEHGPRSAYWLRCELGRRKSDVVAALHIGPFVQIGKGRAARWALVSAERSFNASEASKHWGCNLETAAEFLVGAEGFLSLELVERVNGNGTFRVTERGLAVARDVASWMVA